MLFFPYRADVELHRIPFITIAVCVLCLFIFTQQLSSQSKYVSAIEGFCQSGVERATLTVLRKITHQQQGNPCANVFLTIRESADPVAVIDTLIQQTQPLALFKSQQQERAYMQELISSSYARFDRVVPKNLTDTLQYNPDELNIKRMITSNFSYADWAHIIFNLLFFFAFAAAVEVITGSLTFTVIILAMSVTTGLAYSFSVAGTNEANIPTIGLSGVVMGMMAMLAMIVPWLRIRCFFWFLVFFRKFSVPALVLAAGYVGLDVYSLIQEGNSAGINFVAHVSGAATSALIGAIYWLLRPQLIRDLNVSLNSET